MGCTPALPGARHARTPAPARFPSPFADWCTKEGQQGNIVNSATGYVVRLLVDEPESRLYGMLGKGAIATVTEIFPCNTIEIESVAGIRQFYPEDELGDFGSDVSGSLIGSHILAQHLPEPVPVVFVAIYAVCAGQAAV